MRARVVIIGAGIGGLASGALLAAHGCDVTIIEKADQVGGKARNIAVDGVSVAAGPTVFTLRDVFEDIFNACGANLSDHIVAEPAVVLARHAWQAGEHLDLFADPERSEDAIGDFAGHKAALGYRAFRQQAQRIYELLESTMMRADKPANPLSLASRIGLMRWNDLRAGRPHVSLWKALGEYFSDPRLQQLFARYATYCGSSPFASPATLMLVAHVEAMGVWRIKGGIHALAEAMQHLCGKQGARFRFGETVDEITLDRSAVSGVRLENGEWLAADIVIANGDPTALGDGTMGKEIRRAVRPVKPQHRSLSAYVWMVRAQTQGFALTHHNVFFSDDYAREFADIAAGLSPISPSVYICAQDRPAVSQSTLSGRERLQIIVNAPANGDTHVSSAEEIAQCTRAMETTLARCGLTLDAQRAQIVTGPAQFARLFPSTGGALYGRSSHGWAAPFKRQGARTKIRGLYCAGGATHPGPGVPMAALSGILAVQAVIADHSSMQTFRPAATAGGISMPSAATDAMG